MGFRPDDGVGVDGAVDQIILSELTLEESYSTIVSFNLRRKDEVIIST